MANIPKVNDPSVLQSIILGLLKGLTNLQVEFKDSASIQKLNDTFLFPRSRHRYIYQLS